MSWTLENPSTTQIAAMHTPINKPAIQHQPIANTFSNIVRMFIAPRATDELSIFEAGPEMQVQNSLIVIHGQDCQNEANRPGAVTPERL